MRRSWNGAVFFVRAFGTRGFWMEIDRVASRPMFGSVKSPGT